MNGIVALLSVLPVLAPAAADPAAPAASPGEAVPSDAVLYVNWRFEEDGPLLRRLEGLRSLLAGSGFLEAVRARWVEAAGERPGGASAREAAAKRWFEEETVRWREAVEAVPWWRLASREGAFALRREGEDLGALAVFRVDPAEREETVRALRQVLYTFCSASRRFEMAHSVREGESVDVLYRIPVEDDAAGGQGARRLAGLVDELLGGTRREREICLAGKGSVVAISTSANLLSRSLQLLDGRGSDIGFALSARRQEGLERLGAPPLPEAAGFEVHVRPSELPRSVEVLGAFDSIVAAGGSDGSSFAMAYRAELPPAGGGEAAAVREALEGAGIAGVLRAVPRDATWFRAGSGLLIRAGVELAGGIVDALAPEDASDVVLSLIRDASSRLAGPHALCGSGAGLLFAVELDEEGARFVGDRLRDAMKDADAGEVIEEGGAFLFPAKPGSKALVGLSGKMLLGGTGETARKSLAALAGKEPSLAGDRERLEALGVPPGDLLAITEGDAKVVLGLAAGASILSPLLLRALPEDEEHAVARAFAGALPRLLPAVTGLKFLDRFTAHARKDGRAAVRGEGRVTFAQ